MLTLFALVLASTFAVSNPCPESLCRCHLPLPPPVVALEQAEAVFSGIVLSASGERNPQQPERWPVQVTLRVTRRWKGPVADTLVIRTGEGGGDCGIRFQVGAEYLVYASGENELYTGICHRTRPLVQAGEDVQALGPRRSGRLRIRERAAPAPQVHPAQR
jgi:hypothetical protein